MNVTVCRSEFILGGQKSGKSRLAEMLARQWLDTSPDHRAVLIATAQPWDEEMRERSARHQAGRAERVPGMLTVEEPLNLAEAIVQHSQSNVLLVVDCLTLWLTNLRMPMGKDLVERPGGWAAGRFAPCPPPAKRAGDTKQNVPRPSLLAALTFIVALMFTGMAHALQVTDDRGVTVTLAAPPQRIVSLLPSLTEMVCALDQCQRLVGVDRYSNFPATVRALPQVGGGLDPSIEAVVALKPDVVLMAISSRAAERLQALGIKVVALEPKTHADVRRVLEKVGALLGVDDAQRVWRVIDAGVSAAAQSLPPTARNTSVYFEVNNGPYAAGEVSFIGETLTRLGVKNIVPASLGPFPKLNPEFVVRANPDLVMVGDYNYVGMEQRPGWSSMRALREKRVCLFNRDEADMLVRPGPRMADGARLMARCIADKARTP